MDMRKGISRNEPITACERDERGLGEEERGNLSGAFEPRVR
jgi:hypothetical protein